MAAWEQQPDESAKAYAGFKFYLELEPAKRSIDTAWRVAKGQQKGSKRPPGHFMRWYENHAWKSRAEAWDDHLAAKEFLATEEAIVDGAKERARRINELRETEFKLHKSLIARAEEMLRLPLVQKTVKLQHDDGKEKLVVIEPVRHSARDAGTLLETASKLGRMSLNMPTEPVSVDGALEEGFEGWLEKIERNTDSETYGRVLAALEAE
jgi:hypothetical protein